ncbi:phospholipid scramblase-related protein [Amycolatopsis pigmentata]|uniref:Phospholipid scramblase-related protein n=1 Tax=Amycolatopsis pigmentata TaxID=450801 RepID=A0ABW5G1N2_9PSEU
MTSHSRQAGGGTLFTEPVLVVNQKARLIEAASEFAIFDQHGHPLGTVVELPQSLLRKAVRTLKKYDRNPKHRFEIHDMGGSVVLKLARQAKTPADLVVTRADGTPIGEMTQGHLVGRPGFTFTANGRRVGGIEADDGRSWDFSITDSSGAEVARVTKSFQGKLKEAFAATDNYVVEMHRHIAEPLASLVLAAALTVDKALKKDKEHK